MPLPLGAKEATKPHDFEVVRRVAAPLSVPIVQLANGPGSLASAVVVDLSKISAVKDAMVPLKQALELRRYPRWRSNP